MTGEEFSKAIQETKDGCNKECGNCPLYIPTEKRCLHEKSKAWQKWADGQSKEFQKTLSEY